jgi:microcystin-dependent protein
MTLWKWSQTAANNGTADSTCPFPEGMAPSAVNDGTRGMMAAAAKYRDDISGLLYTAGTSSALTLTTNQGLVSPIGDGQMLSFFYNTGANAQGVTLTVDGIGPYPIQIQAGGVFPLPSGVLIQGGVYRVRYSTNPSPNWVLSGFYGQIYAIPIGGFMPYSSLTPPNSSFILPFGQGISRTVYAAYFAMVGTTFGSGDGSTTFNVPDLRGRAFVCQDNMGGAAAGRVTSAGSGVDGTALGAAGGAQSKTLATTEIPSHNHAVFLNDPGHAHSWQGSIAGGPADSSSGPVIKPGGTGTTTSGTGMTVRDTAGGGGTANQTAGTGGGTAFSLLQPSIVLPVLLRVI